MTGEAWKDFFKADYLLFSEVILSPERTRWEVEQLHRLLKLPAGARILDLGCGQGRIAVPLAKLGYEVTGYDGSADLLEAAERRAAAERADIRWVHGDMRELDFQESFDAVLNLGTAFGYVDEEAGDRDILRRIYAALKPDGLFIQETENREFRLNTRLGRTWDSMNGQPVWSERTFDVGTGRWRETISWQQGGEPRTKVLDLRLYAATELIRMSAEAGLRVLNAWGGLDGSPLGLTSPRLVIEAVKA